MRNLGDPAEYEDLVAWGPKDWRRELITVGRLDRESEGAKVAMKRSRAHPP